MESGYTRKSRKRRTKAQRKARNKRRRELYAERHGQVLRKRGLGKSTFELLKKTQGKGQLATEVLEEMMLETFALAQNHSPLDKHGNFRTRRNPVTCEIEPVGNLDAFLQLGKAAARMARRLAPYQSPKLARRATAEAPSELVERPRSRSGFSIPARSQGDRRGIRGDKGFNGGQRPMSKT
jgi:hypothetical protein